MNKKEKKSENEVGLKSPEKGMKGGKKKNSFHIKSKQKCLKKFQFSKNNQTNFSLNFNFKILGSFDRYTDLKQLCFC